MNILYIDANIYLGFYNSNRPEFKKLLSSIDELSDKIFFTEQIGNEIDRNKLNVLGLSIENYVKQGSLIKTILPEHFDDINHQNLAKWNTTRKKLDKDISNSNKELLSMVDHLLQNVSNSKDNVSKSLSKLYKKAYTASSDIMAKARQRKELGNPPGKPNDPLGDQLSWEMLLNIIHRVNNIWIISTDRDYFTESNGKLYLNPLLTQDLLSLNSKIKIKVFNKLSDALQDFNQQEQIISIPTNDQLKVISNDENMHYNLFQHTLLHSDNIDIVILKLLSDGNSVGEIAEILKEKGLNISSIEKKINHLKIIFNANNTVHLVTIAKDLNLI